MSGLYLSQGSPDVSLSQPLADFCRVWSLSRAKNDFERALVKTRTNAQVKLKSRVVK